MSIAMAAAVEAPTQGDRTTGLTDQDLVAAVRRGDDRAFEQLYSRYQRRIAAYIYGMVNDYAKAEDITQEVFISALRRMRETERPIAFKPWVYEIAKNACIDQFRRSRRAEEVSYDAEEGLGAADYGRLVTTGPSLDAAVDTKQQLDHLCGAFGGLSETHHQILVLRELEGLSYREIGEKMGLSRPSVESTLFRARKRLTEEYDELVSGQRCVRIQSIIESATEGDLGARDTRRLARHVSHCQPCRRQALAAGIDTGTIERRRPLGEKVAARAAALFPFPMFFRRDKADAATSAGSNGLLAQMPAMGALAEPVVVGWGKAAAAATALIIASAGAGAVTSGSGGLDVPAPSVSNVQFDRSVAGDTSRATDSARSHQNVGAPAAQRSDAGRANGAPSASQPKRAGGSGGSAPIAPIPGPPVDRGSVPNEITDGPKAPPELGGDPNEPLVPGTSELESRAGIGNSGNGGSANKGPSVVQEVEDQATAANGDAGQAVHDAREAIGG